MKDLLTLNEFSGQEIEELIDKSMQIKKDQEKYFEVMRNKTLIMLFQKPSTRTRCSFEVGMTQLGGHAMYLDWHTTQLTKASIKDEMLCMSRYADIIMARVYKHEDVVAMAASSTIPVINALSNLYHPCQILADLMTIKEKKGKLKGLTLAYVGDGNNVCNTLIIGCSKVGMKINVATPKGYIPNKEAIEIGKSSGMLKLMNDPKEAVKGADIVYTDTWVSMGQEKEKEERMKIFKDYQVTAELLGNALFMHCLPAQRGYEVTDEVIDSKSSVVYDQAENRLHIQKGIMLKLLGKT